MEKAAAFLETRRYAAYLGATTEFTKMEGQAHNAADKKLYTVISYVRKGMIDGKNKNRPQDDIKLAGNAKDLTCGVVYESRMTGGQKDRSGAAIASDWVAVDMTALVTGAQQPKGAESGRYDKCDTERVANPDNVNYSEAMRTLFIGEDSGNHLNNFTWAFNVDTKTGGAHLQRAGRRREHRAEGLRQRQRPRLCHRQRAASGRRGRPPQVSGGDQGRVAPAWSTSAASSATSAACRR